jgi:hypothetical protein
MNTIELISMPNAASQSKEYFDILHNYIPAICNAAGALVVH